MTQYQTLLLPDDTVKPGAFNTLDWFSHIIQEVNFRGKDVVDYGCAEGVMSLLSKRSGATKVHGVDIDRERIEQACKSSTDLNLPVNFYSQSLYELNIGSDIGIFSLIIHWLNDPQKDLRDLLGRVDDTAIIIFREYNELYQSSNGNWFPTLEELDTYMASCSFECKATKLLQTQDNNKNIYLKVFKRTKKVFFTDDGRYVVKVGGFSKNWGDMFGILKNALDLPTRYHGSNVYISRRFYGTRLSEMKPNDKIKQFIDKYREAFNKTGLMFTDMSPGNIIYEPATGYHLIDFDDIGVWDENNERWRELCKLI